MALIVQKYGGTSVGSVARVHAVAEQVAALRAQGHQVAVVVSAMGDSTDRLLDLARQLSPTPASRELDALLATGEMVSCALLAMALCDRGWPAKSYNALQLPLTTTGVHGRARIEGLECAGLRADCTAGVIPVFTGFQGRGPDGSITTIGRGGSDTSAVALAVALQADECQILTDVDGVYTADPRVVPDARRLDRISFEEMLEMAGQGSRVLHLRSVEFAARHGVRLRVLSSFRPGPGTLICEEDTQVEAPVVAGIAFNRDEAEITVSGLPDRPGVAHALLEPVAAESIEVDMIVSWSTPRARAASTSPSPCTATTTRGPASWLARWPRGWARTFAATTGSPSSPSSAPACAPTPGWPAGCSRRWPRRVSTSGWCPPPRSRSACSWPSRSWNGPRVPCTQRSVCPDNRPAAGSLSRRDRKRLDFVTKMLQRHRRAARSAMPRVRKYMFFKTKLGNPEPEIKGIPQSNRPIPGLASTHK